MKDVEGFNLYLLPVTSTGEGIEVGPPGKITSLRNFTFAPVWSPDGRQLAFGSAEGGSLQVWSVAPEGGALRRFEHARLHPVARPLHWAPGPEIIYASPEGGRLRRLDVATGGTEPLVRADSVSAMDAAVWSPDGTRFAVRVYRGYEDSVTGIWIASPERLLTRLTPDWGFVPVAWADDGRRVLLMRPGRAELFAIGLQGGSPVEVATLPFESPDWTRLAVYANGTEALYSRLSDRRDLWLLERLDGAPW
jgi:WD40 repeat protein